MKTNPRRRGNENVCLHLHIPGAFGTEKPSMKKSFLVLFCATLAVASAGCANLSAKKIATQTVPPPP
jgi:hypothetical protein